MDNREALGYMLLACKELGYSKSQVRLLLREMSYMILTKTVEDTEGAHEWYTHLVENEHE
ncbi:hypothetical protein [Alkalihalobacterium elongatum]|uniref:hypothetical protein n=1 Tax=Alkalihalobacterium elongatum TaxID=2675466 RepID=UPI001C1F77F8|nr:hypothetical protein [Alkalihalobacterium elongatum]